LKVGGELQSSGRSVSSMLLGDSSTKSMMSL
jgi:hypothetical protein